MKKLSRRSFLKVMGAATAAGVVAACSDSSSTSTSTASTATDSAASTETAKSNVTLSIMSPQDQIKDIEQEVLAARFEEQTGIKIDFQITPSTEYDTLLATKLNTGTCADIFSAQSGALTINSRYDVENNCVDMSGESWFANYDETTASAGSYNGGLYAVSFWDLEGNGYGMMYNKRIYEDLALEVPSTYEELKANCEVIKEAGIIPVYESGVDSWHPTCSYIELFIVSEANNPGTFDKLNNNEMKVADIPEAIELTNQFQEVGQNYSGNTYLSNEFAAAMGGLATGQYAMFYGSPTRAAEIDTDYPDELYCTDDIGIFVMPYLDNQVRNVNPQGPSRFVYSQGEHVAEALQYIEFLASDESLQTFVDEEDAFANMPFSNVEPAASQILLDFCSDYPDTATVMQAAVSYVDAQWMDVSADILSLYTDQMTAEKLLANMDDRRETQALQEDDPAWL